jgi:beta-barrel assembly-enhancing protease
MTETPSFFQHASRLLLIALLATLLVPGYAQQDFNHFRSLSAQGTIPADFTTTTREKIEQDIATNRTELSTAKQKIFLEGIHRSIDQILNSGSVIYGDEVTLYVQSVAANLLRNQPELLGKLRFYTIKSNETNALSTDQGIVFVTTGLISQLTSEAQLAYVLSHEISHYTERHVVETFDWKIKNRYQRDHIRQLSVYSKEHELAADKLALKWYHEAGYSEDEILSTFDVLMYSYLPFDEVEVPNAYFSSEHLYIPDSYFTTQKYPIKAEEDYDDERSSHPNIKKRKDAALEACKKYENWGNVVFSQGESKFYYIRNLARFESVRTDIIDANFGDALYSIFLLEQEFPQSVYLKQMKSLVWLGLAQFKEANQQSKTIPGTSDYEGESAKLFSFLKKLNDDAMMTMALRTIYDIHRELPADPVVNGVMDRMTRALAENDHFEWSDYSLTDFHTSARKSLVKDTVPAVTDVKTDAQKSKYDKIKTKKNVNAPESFDSSRFYVYGLSDILLDSVLRSAYTSYKTPYEEKKAEKEAYRKLTNKEKYELDKQNKAPKPGSELAIGMEACILVQPTVTDYKGSTYNWERSEKRQAELTDAIADVSDMAGVEVSQLDQDDIILNGTASFNERSTLYALLEQTAHYEGVAFFPVDYEALKAIEHNYGTSNLMYTLVEHHYDADINWGIVGYSAVLFPTLPLTILIYMPIKLISGHHTEITVLIIDSATGEMKASTLAETRTRPLRHHIGAQYYAIFKQLKSTPLR